MEPCNTESSRGFGVTRDRIRSPDPVILSLRELTCVLDRIKISGLIPLKSADRPRSAVGLPVNHALAKTLDGSREVLVGDGSEVVVVDQQSETWPTDIDGNFLGVNEALFFDVSFCS